MSDSPDFLGFITSNNNLKYEYYGFNVSGCWQIEDYYHHDKDVLTEATEQEVKEALIAEAKRRGFKVGVKVKCLFRDKEVELDMINFRSSDGGVLYGGCGVPRIFYDGKWATIIEEPKEMTVEQISKELGYDIKIVKEQKHESNE